MHVRRATYNEVQWSSLCGYVHATYEQLVDAFGLPHNDGDGYKVDREWMLRFQDGTVATVYNWKNGPNYCGEYGIPVERITQWHVGGHSQDAVARVQAELDAMLA